MLRVNVTATSSPSHQSLISALASIEIGDFRLDCQRAGAPGIQLFPFWVPGEGREVNI
jgi:hypothetical protein